ncbi:Flavodoxin [Anaerobranca californiensis DSM 14826]|jgi:flavodoxin|uniref:Flavodoxin n=1 Tax=Anaerobranca californiensis DSM 14826 TaxID=1120989 RepID=A0A1M6QJY0_9FIRM|nr:flavodoxin [Anaerobranca californiensis]SHK20373.1 Flavodoxin [Anaerobranca californiensis DSM 14826]
MVKTLVIYYSFEGNTKFIAETIAEKLGADLLELKPEKELNSKGFMKYIWGGSQVVMGKMPKLQPLDKNPLDYDLLIIGTPVWAWSYTPPLNTFFNNVKITGKKIALFSCHGGQNAKTFEKMEKALEGNEIIAKQDFFEPLRDKEENKKKAENFCSLIISSINGKL